VEQATSAARPGTQPRQHLQGHAPPVL